MAVKRSDIEPRGRVRIVCTSTDGAISVIESDNLIMDAVKEAFMGALNGEALPGLEITHMAFGSDGTASTGSMTALGSQIGDRYPVSVMPESDTTTVYGVGLDETEANGNTIREIGLFTAATAGTMIGRVVLDTPISKTSSLILSIYYTVSIT